jgi:hypothetical protein
LSLSLGQQNETQLKFAFRRDQLSTIDIWYIRTVFLTSSNFSCPKFEYHELLAGILPTISRVALLESFDWTGLNSSGLNLEWTAQKLV